MGGLGRLFSRIIPIIMLVCFVCLGITHTFNQIGAENHTYLTNETINVGTQENPNNITYYNFDVISYVNNVNIDILKEATNKVIDTETYKDNFESFNILWNDGYQLGDVSNTILNSVILVINTLITTINLVLFPVRIIAGILLTGMSLVGINISTQGIIVNSLKALLTSLAIPLIIPTTSKQDADIINGTTWQLNQTQTNYSFYWDKNSVIFYMQYSQNATYECVHTQKMSDNWWIVITSNNTQITIWRNGVWLNDYYKNWYIVEVNGSTSLQQNVYNTMSQIGTKI